MKVQRGDVVLVDYPFSDRTGSKVRPALVVQNDNYNRHIDDTILAAISRSTHRASATQLFVDISTTEGAATGLRQNSMIQCRKSADLRPGSDHCNYWRIFARFACEG